MKAIINANPQAPVGRPDLRDRSSKSKGGPPHGAPCLRGGCYLIKLTTSSNKPGGRRKACDGTLRVETTAAGIRAASGDLYGRQGNVSQAGPVPATSPAAGIPVFPRKMYDSYLCVTKIPQSPIRDRPFRLEFKRYRPGRLSNGRIPWTLVDHLSGLMDWSTGDPSGADCLDGDVQDSTGAVVGHLAMRWISKYLRRATVVIDHVAGSKPPLDNGARVHPVDWPAVGKGIGWKIDVKPGNPKVAGSGKSWSDAECHSTLRWKSGPKKLDAEWLYHILAVPLLADGDRGVMYDWAATDSNHLPRQGCVVSSDWRIPRKGWGTDGGKVYWKTPGYFRTAVHEMGHAMGLNDADYYNTFFMNESQEVAVLGTRKKPYPKNITWAFHKDDQFRLRHLPDPFVRPGGIPWIIPCEAVLPMPTARARRLTLEASPVSSTVPLGAPVRINVKLQNNAASPVLAPQRLSLSSGFVSGEVIGPGGKARTFRPLVVYSGESPLAALPAGKSVKNSLTLLRGGEGALFPTAGPHRIRVTARWKSPKGEIAIAGETDVVVKPAENPKHAIAAKRVLSTPDTLLTLALGGDYPERGIEAIQAALKDPVLKPHFAYVEAKRLATPFLGRAADLNGAAQLIAENTVMSPDEAAKAKAYKRAGLAGSLPGRRKIEFRGTRQYVPE